MNNLDYALHYAEVKGWAVFPCNWIKPDGNCSCGNPECSSPGKHPLTRKGVKEATKDADQIRHWWSIWPDANIAIATGEPSGLLVLDIDTKPNANGYASLAKIEEEIGCCRSSVRVNTPSGGQHHYFLLPEGEIKNSAGRIGAGLDVRATGGYVIAPPSNHKAGGTYNFQIERKSNA